MAGRALAAAVALTTTGSMPAFLTGMLGVQVKASLGIGDAALGAAITTFYAAGSLVAAAGGRLADHLGWRQAIQLVAAASATSLLLIAVAGQRYGLLLGFLAIGGTAFGMTTPTANLVVARELPRHRRGLAFGIKQGAVPTATFLAGLAVPAVALTIGWRWAFGIALLLPAAAIALSPRELADRVSLGEQEPEDQPRFVVPWELRALAVAGALIAVAVGALNAFVVVSAVAAGMDAGTAGLVVAIASLLTVAVRVVAGWRIDGMRGDGFSVVAIMVALGGGGFLLLMTGRPVLMVLGIVVAYAAGWGWPGLFQYALVSRFPTHPGSASGVTQTGFTAGVALGPLLFGTIADSGGYGLAWGLTAAASGAGALLLATAVHYLRRDQGRTPLIR